jgi:hypothetical protein
MKQLCIRVLALAVVAFCLNGCYLMDQIAAVIKAVKGDRAVSFLIFEPYEYTTDDKCAVAQMIGFNEETQGLENTYNQGVSDAAGDRPWTPIWYTERDYMKSFYSSVLGVDDRRGFLRNHLNEVRGKDPKASECEVLIYTFVISKPNNDSAYEVVALAYDLKQDTFASKKRVIPRDQGSRKFKEDMGHLVLDLCEALYGTK